MTAKVTTLSIVILAGLLFGVLPVTWLYGADSDRVDPSRQENFNIASVHFILVQIERSDGNRLAARFTYTRGVTENAFNLRDKAEEEEDTEQKFEVSSGVVLEARQMHLTGFNMNDDIATLLLMKADL
jgi:hypothetical protein